jgi:hypothetical protein
MTAIEREARCRVDQLPHGREGLDIDMIDASTTTTHDVWEHIVGEVVHGPTMVEMHVADHAELGERVERAIDGRDVNLGRDGREVFGHVVSGGMGLCPDQCLEHQTTLWGDAAAGVPESLERLVHLGVVGHPDGEYQGVRRLLGPRLRAIHS